ncbi:MAG: hypothetical protein HY909_16010 [Deltaproteobacteria bacterium]|nr:hypothetical protein [Deltaproteobacteria bacterium]
MHTPTKALLLAAALLFGCRKKSEEERLRAQLETNSVYFYLAVKSAVSATDDPGTRAVREQFTRIERAMHATPVTSPGGNPAAAPTPSAAPAPAAAPTPPPITAQDMAEIAVGVWRLRAEGRRRLAMGRGDGLRLLAPVLREGGASARQLDPLDVETEHIVLMTALLALKFHPRNPVPIPPELPLYEAWRAQPEAMPLRALIPVATSLRAVVFGLNDYCDLAARDANSPALSATDFNPRAFEGALDQLTATTIAVAPEQARAVFEGANAVSHLAAGLCYQTRGDAPRADVELGRFVSAAERAGVPPEDTAPLRAWLAYRRGDMPEVRRQLVTLRNNPNLDNASREELDRLLRDFNAHDDRALARHFDKAWFTLLLARTVYNIADRAGLIDALEATALGAAALGVARATDGVVHVTHGASGAAGERLQGARGWLDRHRHRTAPSGAATRPRQ